MYCCRVLHISWLFYGIHSVTGRPDKVHCNATTLYGCTVTKRLRKRNLASRASPEAFDSRRAISVMNARPSLLMGPKVSTAIGTTVYVLSSSAYFECLLVAAFSAALPASIAVSATYEAATVSTTVASHIKDRPSFQGTRVWPSDLFPSSLVRPDGSLIAGVPALLRLRRMMSFM